MNNFSGSLEKPFVNGGDSGLGSLDPKQAKPQPNKLIRRYIIEGERRFSNYWWTFTVFVGASGFLYTGISAYLGQSLIDFVLGSFTSTSTSVASDMGQANALTQFDIPFFPQGLLMSFYGSLGLLLSLYWILVIFWNVGGGFNEFNKKDGFIRIFRWGYPGKNRKIDLIYNLKDVEAIRVELKQGLDPQRTIYLRLKGTNPMAKLSSEPSSGSGLKPQAMASATTKADGAKFINFKREIPLTGISQPLTLKEIEKQASELANFLQVSLEGL